MKKILLILSLLFSISFAQDTVSKKEAVMAKLLQNVLIKNTNDAIKTSKTIFSNLENKKDLKILKQNFRSFIISWKKVEAFYLASEFNVDVIDTPRYIDVFHNLKENLFDHMHRVIKSSDSLDITMYKNSYKTVNALEIVLYDKTFTPKHNEISKIIVKNIINRLNTIKHTYENSSKRFVNDFKWANDIIINTLIDSSFKVRDWRVGDISGHSRKYRNKGDNRRAEYYLSKNSYYAIKSILESHKEVMNSKSYDFGDMLIKNSYKKEVLLIRGKIDEAVSNLKYIKNDDFSKKDVTILYKSLDELHIMYYKTLLSALGVTSKILDADGD